MVQHLAAPQRRGDLGLMAVVFGDVQADAACADDPPLCIEQGRRGEGEAGDAAVAALEPGAPAPHRHADAERIEAVRSAPSASNSLGGLADQRGGGPAERRVGHDEDEAAPFIGLEGKIGGLDDQVPPALAAVQQGVAQPLAGCLRSINGCLRRITGRFRRRSNFAGGDLRRGGSSPTGPEQWYHASAAHPFLSRRTI